MDQYFCKEEDNIFKERNQKYRVLFLALLLVSVFVFSDKIRLFSRNSVFEFGNQIAHCLSNSYRRNLFKQIFSCCLFSYQEVLSGVVVITSKDTVQHQGISLTMEGSVNLQLSAKGVGVFEAFYNSVKVRPVQISIFSTKPLSFFSN